jgi:hypothetical protein
MKKKIDPIGPQTKRETKKTVRANRKIITPLSPAGTAAAKAAKKKERIKTAATVAGSVAGVLTKMAYDARISRGAIRLGTGNVYSTNKQRWNAGKGRDTDKKSTKK